MAVFTPVSLEDIIPWAEQFAVGQVRSIEGISSGIENSNFFLNAEHGEFVLTMLLSLAHRVPTMVDWQRAVNWPSSPVRRKEMTPLPIRGATVGILGYGSIAREVGRLVTGLGARVVVTKHNVNDRADHGYCRPGTGDPEGLLPERW